MGSGLINGAAGGGGATASGFAQRVALEFNPIGGVNNAVQDRVGIRGIPNDFMMPSSAMGWYVEPLPEVPGSAPHRA